MARSRIFLAVVGAGLGMAVCLSSARGDESSNSSSNESASLTDSESAIQVPPAGQAPATARGGGPRGGDCDTPALCDGDVNGDESVDPLDVGAILARFGLDPCEESNCQYDVNCDGGIDPLDSGYVLARFGTCDPPAVCNLSGCDGPPINDSCEDVTPEPLYIGETLVFEGDNTGATMTCDALDFPETWHAFELMEDASVTISLCGTNPPFGDPTSMIDDNCPCDGTFIFASSLDQTMCDDGNWSMHYDSLPATTYYSPVAATSANIGIYAWGGRAFVEFECKNPRDCGACCAPESGACSVTSESMCDSDGGTYAGDDTTCDDTDNDRLPDVFEIGQDGECGFYPPGTDTDCYSRTDPATADTDGDGILDGDEFYGTQHLDLPAMGADPCIPDIFLECDWVYKNAPGENPDQNKPDPDQVRGYPKTSLSNRRVHPR